MSADGLPPLVVHVIHRLDFGGLENGLVNLVNRMPSERYRHAILCLEGFNPVIKSRFGRSRGAGAFDRQTARQGPGGLCTHVAGTAPTRPIHRPHSQPRHRRHAVDCRQRGCLIECMASTAGTPRIRKDSTGGIAPSVASVHP